MNAKKNIRYIVTGAVIASCYVGLTFFSNLFGLAYLGVQFRISEALTILPVFGTVSIPALAVGCFISNIASFNPIDMVFGTLATVLASVLTYYLKKIKFLGIPFLSFLAPVVVNALIVGFEIAFFFTEGTATAVSFILSALLVALGEFTVCFGLGIPLYFAVKNNGTLLNFFS
mgnify:CR=1 FL=1